MRYSVKKKVFISLTVLLPFCFFLFLELGLRFFSFGNDLSLFIPAPGQGLKYLICNSQVARRYFVNQEACPGPVADSFLRQKPENGYRIFVMGGSTTYGFPYLPNLMFPRILQKKLQLTFPDKKIEVINTAMTAVNSYTLADLIDEIIQQRPDAVLVYAGHNEYYGALGVGSQISPVKSPVMKKLYLKLLRFKSFLLIRHIIESFQHWINPEKSDESENPYATLMERMVEKNRIAFGGTAYKGGIAQFENNMREIIEKTKDAGISLLLSEVVSNIRDTKPFISETIDSLLPAADLYNRARKSEMNGDIQQAKRLYYKAKDMDLLRFRAPEAINTAIHRLATEYHIPLVPMISSFEVASADGLIGDALMTDHLHPNITGYFLMADAFYKSMKENHFIIQDWDIAEMVDSDRLRSEWGYSALDSMYGIYNIMVLKNGWPFKAKKSRPVQILDSIQTQTRIDSLAAMAVRYDNVSLTDSRESLIHYYEVTGQINKLYREYLAQIYVQPLLTTPYLKIAEIHIQRKEYDQALNYLQSVLQIKNLPLAFKWMGDIYINQKQAGRALPYLKEADTLLPGDPGILQDLRSVYLMLGNAEEAERIISRLRKAGIEMTAPEQEKTEDVVYPVPKEIYPYMQEAQKYLRKKEPDKALAVLKKSIEIQPTGLAYRWIGEIFLRKREPENALKFLERAQEDYRADTKFLYILASTYMLVKKNDKAYQTWLRIKKIDPDYPDPLHIEQRVK